MPATTTTTKRQKRRAFVLLIVVMLLAVLGVAVAVQLDTARGQSIESSRTRDDAAARAVAETCLDPETRILRRITMEDAMAAHHAAEMFDTLMGTDVARRRQFLLENSELVDLDALDV